MRMEEYWSVWFWFPSACWAGGQFKLTVQLLTADCSEARSGDGNLGPARALPFALGRNLTSDVQGAKWARECSQASLEDAWKWKGTAPHRRLHPFSTSHLWAKQEAKLDVVEFGTLRSWHHEALRRAQKHPPPQKMSIPSAGSQRLDPSGARE